jgi:hypothetical protein
VKPAVLNASPLIVLARAGYLDLIPKLVSSVVTTGAASASCVTVSRSIVAIAAASFMKHPPNCSPENLSPNTLRQYIPGRYGHLCHTTIALKTLRARRIWCRWGRSL